jgi:hypothetical protein
MRIACCDCNRGFVVLLIVFVSIAPVSLSIADDDAYGLVRQLTTRGPNGPAVVGVPVWPRTDLANIRCVPAEGYSVRSQALGGGRCLLAWVRTVSGRNHDYFFRILDSFDFNSFARAGF